MNHEDPKTQRRTKNISRKDAKKDAKVQRSRKEDAEDTEDTEKSPYITG